MKKENIVGTFMKAKENEQEHVKDQHCIIDHWSMTSDQCSTPPSLAEQAWCLGHLISLSSYSPELLEFFSLASRSTQSLPLSSASSS